MNLFYLPPTDDIVESNPQIAKDLIACGRLMQMGLIHRKNTDIDNEPDEPQFAAWVSSVLLNLSVK